MPPRQPTGALVERDLDLDLFARRQVLGKLMRVAVREVQEPVRDERDLAVGPNVAEPQRELPLVPFGRS